MCVELLLFVGLMALNLLISWWNCRVVGSIWHETKATGGFMRVLAWCGAVQSTVGFSAVLLVVMIAGAFAFGYLPMEYAKAAASLWYLMVVVPAIGTGLIITVHSLIEAWRERSMASMGTAAWNTIATGHNLYSAASSVPSAWKDVSDALFDGDGDSRKVVLVLLIVAVAIAGGALITAMLIRHYSSEAKRRAAFALA